MLCNECGKNQATVHSVQILNGVRKESHLCAECAAKHADISSLGAFNVSDFFKGFLDMGTPNYVVEGCRNCGTTLADFKRDGRLGCSECYNQFRRNIIPVLRQVHGNVTHAGDVPREADEQTQRRRELEKLRGELQKAVEGEDFERAAQLRDQINALKGEVA